MKRAPQCPPKTIPRTRLAVRRTLLRALRPKPPAHWAASPKKPRIPLTMPLKVLRMPLMTLRKRQVMLPMLPMMLRRKQVMSLMMPRVLSTTLKKTPRTESLQMLRVLWTKPRKVSKMASLQMLRVPWMKLRKVSKMASLQMPRMPSMVFRMMSMVFRMMSTVQWKMLRMRLATPSRMPKMRQVTLLMMLRMA